MEVPNRTAAPDRLGRQKPMPSVNLSSFILVPSRLHASAIITNTIHQKTKRGAMPPPKNNYLFASIDSEAPFLVKPSLISSQSRCNTDFTKKVRVQTFSTSRDFALARWILCSLPCWTCSILCVTISCQGPRIEDSTR